MSETDFSLAPASFKFLVESTMMQTQMQLAILNLSGEGEVPNLPIARQSIAILQEKTRGNLSTEEHRMLENGLTKLRFRFMQVTEELQPKRQRMAQEAAVGMQTA